MPTTKMTIIIDGCRVDTTVEHVHISTLHSAAAARGTYIIKQLLAGYRWDAGGGMHAPTKETYGNHQA
jgi:hypothetical protein